MKKLLILCALTISILSVKAEDPFFQASLTPDIAIHSKTTRIGGVCLSIWGENPQSALAIGFVNGSTGESKGLSWGLFNYCDTYTGVSWAFINVSKEKFIGWQDGAVNVAKEFHGLQMGFLNVADNLQNGVQIGFLNIANNNPWFDDAPKKLAKGFPFVNWSF